MTNLIWFRSDLRIHDNPALYQALTQQSKVKAIFYVTMKQWRQHGWGNNKIAFVMSCVAALQQDLAGLNVELEIRKCDTFADTVQDLAALLQNSSESALYFNHEYELNERRRDEKIQEILRAKNIACYTFHSQCLIKPGLIINKQDNPYTVFTPFKKACYEYLYRSPITLGKTPPKQNGSVIVKQEIRFPEIDRKISDLWPCDVMSIAERLETFRSAKITNYDQQRDFPALAATSTLSPYLACGRISVQECFIAATATNNGEFATGNPGVVCWINELIWRDFYKHIIFHFPDLCKGANFNKKYDKLKWQQPGPELLAWQQGKTGVPIIDAAMRQLVNTGWMHNRLRMIVAMFLTKNLLIDWRHGERFFGEHLIDLDLAANNGGWQWSASTGTDAVPYFRIFNPISQSIKFDPEGVFIKQYCPELKALSGAELHDPSNYLSDTKLNAMEYPRCIIDLKASRARALAYFKAV